MVAEIGLTPFMAFIQRLEQDVGVEQIIAHRSISPCRIGRHRTGMFGLFLKLAYSMIVIRRDNTERPRIRQRHGQCSDCYLCLTVLVEVHHLLYIHAIDMIGTEDQYQIGFMILDQIEILVDGIRSALKPVGTLLHLWWHHGDELMR